MSHFSAKVHRSGLVENCWGLGSGAPLVPPYVLPSFKKGSALIITGVSCDAATRQVYYAEIRLRVSIRWTTVG